MNMCATVILGTLVAQPKGFMERIKQHFPKAIRQRATLIQELELTDPNQQELGQIQLAKQKVRLNSTQRAIQSLANIYWNPASVHATILIGGLKS